MLELVAGGATFIALHLLVSGTPVRHAVVRSIGEGPYMGLFSLASLAALAWMISAYGGLEAPNNPVVWWPPSLWRELGVPINLLAIVLVVLGLISPNPTLTKMEFLLERGDPVKGIVRVSRHPMLMGILLWAVYHVVANGDAGSIVFFGTFVVTTVLGPAAIDAKRKQKMGDLWSVFAEKTSVIPFWAILRGRNHFSFNEIGVPRILFSLVVFSLFFWGHEWLFGVSAEPI